MQPTDWLTLFQQINHPAFTVPEVGFGSFGGFGTGGYAPHTPCRLPSPPQWGGLLIVPTSRARGQP